MIPFSSFVIIIPKLSSMTPRLPAGGSCQRRLTERLYQICDCPMSPTAPSFPSCRKRRGRKGALGYVWCFLRLSLGKPQCFGLAFHSGVTLRASWYAPPDTGVSNLQLVSVEYLPSIEGATELLMGATFLRGPCSGAIIRQRSTANSGWRSLCGDQSSISSNASSPFLASALTSPWRTKSMVTKLRATNSAA